VPGFQQITTSISKHFTKTHQPVLYNTLIMLMLSPIVFSCQSCLQTEWDCNWCLFKGVCQRKDQECTHDVVILSIL